MMNERIDELLWQAGGYTKIHNPNDSFLDGRYAITQEQLDKFAELIVRECAGLIHLECKDFANGNCFHDDALWKSVTTEYGKNKERGFDPIGMSIHFDKMLNYHFGIEQ